jgi:sortase A
MSTVMTAVAAALLVTGCTGAATGDRARPVADRATTPPPPAERIVPTEPATPPALQPRRTEHRVHSVPRAVPSDGRPRRALLTIPALGLRDLRVVPYRGWTDDAAGTEIQNRGRAASPFGPRGGVGPGGIGNYQVTAHRTSSTRAFEFLPNVKRGDRVIVEAGEVRYVYEVRSTRETSFRSQRSLAEQRAAVPGSPGTVASRAFITLSTCATLEDHAAGNYWADEFDNPEHRIDKIGVLVRTVDG